MPFCHQCGTEVAAKATVCHQCGTLLIVKGQPAQAASSEPIEQTQPVVYQQPTVAAAESIEQPEILQPSEQPTYQPPMPTPMQPTYLQSVNNSTAPASGRLKVGMLVWSIITIVISLFLLDRIVLTLFTLPLGVVALIMTCTAAKASDAGSERGRLKAALVLNIIASALITMLLLITMNFSIDDTFDYSDPSYNYDI